MKNRIEAIDIAKGLGIILVVFGHLTNTGEWQRILVHSFHMPMFMILSGYCFHSDSVIHIVVKAAKRYLIFAYVTLAIDIPVSLVFAHQPFPNAWGWLKTFTLSGGLWRNTPIWFLFTLTLCQILMTLCLKLPKEVRPFVIGAFVLLNILLTFQIGWWVTATLSAFPFFAFGCCAASRNALHNVKKWGGRASIGLLLLLGIAALGNGYTDMYSLVSGKSYLVFMFTGILGTLLMLQFAGAIVKFPRFKSVCLQLGTKTFIILISHYYICRMAVPKLLSLLGMNYLASNIFFQLVATMIIVCVYLIIFHVCKTWKLKNLHP